METSCQADEGIQADNELFAAHHFAVGAEDAGMKASRPVVSWRTESVWPSTEIVCPAQSLTDSG